MLEEKLLLGLLNAVHRAGQAILDHYEGDVEVISKDDGSPVTAADYASNTILNEFFADYSWPVMSEENERNSYELRQTWKTYWCVDPLDGTYEFLKKNGEFAINVALMEQNSPTFGLIYRPTTQEVWYTTEDAVLKGVLSKPINDLAEVDWLIFGAGQEFDSVIVVSHSYRRGETLSYVQKRMQESPDLAVKTHGSALKFCLIAEGKASEYPRFAPTMEWDTASGQAILNKVGKQLLHWKTGKPLEYNKRDLRNDNFIVR